MLYHQILNQVQMASPDSKALLNDLLAHATAVHNEVCNTGCSKQDTLRLMQFHAMVKTMFSSFLAITTDVSFCDLFFFLFLFPRKPPTILSDIFKISILS